MPKMHKKKTMENLRTVFNGGKWTKGRFDAWVTSLLRGGSRRWGPKYECLNAAKTEKKVNSKTGRIAQHYRCACCQNEFTQKDIQVDHITPIGTGLTWDEFIDGLFCEIENLQVLCISCHAKKTALERSKNAKK